MHDFAIYKFSSLFLDYGAVFVQTPTLGAKFMFILQYIQYSPISIYFYLVAFFLFHFLDFLPSFLILYLIHCTPSFFLLSFSPSYCCLSSNSIFLFPIFLFLSFFLSFFLVFSFLSSSSFISSCFLLSSFFHITWSVGKF